MSAWEAASPVHRVDAHDRLGAGIDLVDLAAVRAVIDAVAVPILAAIGVRHAAEIGGDALADPQAAIAGDPVEDLADDAAVVVC